VGAGAQDARIPLTIPATGYARIDEPDDLPDAPATVLVAIHGYGQPPEDMLAYARSIAPPGTVVVAPEGPQAFYRRPRAPGGAAKGGVGYGWIADPRRADADVRNDALIAAALDAAAQRRPIRRDAILLLGYSQGAGVATHFALRQPASVAGLVGLAGGVPSAWRDRLAGLSATPVLWISGTRDASYPPDYVAPLRESFRAGGVPLEHLDLDEGHDLLARASPHVRSWLAARAE
jgi:phospholipase/carboxylesterase